jgi:uncharacterized protein YceH (UPF0502 family)
MSAFDSASEEALPPVTELSKRQRRVLGVLIEKGITTPEYYPLTLKALTTGCNQKNNRAPVTEYSEADVSQTLDELRELGLIAAVHTESGRSERYRHYARKRFPFNEAQLAIMTELWLRGRQSIGELRTRASRMHDIPTLEQLRAELQALLAGGYIQASGALESRGVEVDHNFYRPDENQTLPRRTPTAACTEEESHESDSAAGQAIAVNTELADRLQHVEQELARLRDRFDALCRELGASV